MKNLLKIASVLIVICAFVFFNNSASFAGCDCAVKCPSHATVEKMMENFPKSDLAKLVGWTENNLTKEGKELLHNYFKKTVELLNEKELLDKKVDLSEYLKFSHTVVSQTLETHLIYVFLGIKPDEKSTDDLGTATSLIASLIEFSLDSHKSVLEDLLKDDGKTLQEKLTKYGASEEIIMKDFKNLLNNENLEIYLKSNLTFRQLIENQSEFAILP